MENKMTQYIVAVKKPTADLPNVLGRKEELACEIISHFCCDAHAKVNLFAFEADSNLATLALLDKSAIASIEIDDVSEKQWEKEIFNIYKRELAVRKALESSFHNIMSAAIAFEQVCYESTNFQEVEVCEDLNVANAFDGIGTTAHEQISEIVIGMFKVNYL